VLLKKSPSLKRTIRGQVSRIIRQAVSIDIAIF